VLSGLLRPDEVLERTGVAVPEGRYETIAGLLAERLQRLPEPGDSIRLDDAEFTVETVEGRRVARVRVHRLETPDDASPAGADVADRPRQQVPA
jgi:CBS domain containing-hemolysin-like protein